MEKSQSSLHKAFYNGGVVDLHQDYPHDSAVLLSDGTTKYLHQDSGAVETVVLKDKTVKICKRCIRRLVELLKYSKPFQTQDRFYIRIICIIHCRRKNADKKAAPSSWRHDYSRVDRFFLVFLPFLFLIFNFLYWGYFLLGNWW